MDYDEDDIYDDYADDDGLSEVMAVMGKRVTEEQALEALEKADYDTEFAITLLKRQAKPAPPKKLAPQKEASPKGKLTSAGAASGSQDSTPQIAALARLKAKRVVPTADGTTTPTSTTTGTKTSTNSTGHSALGRLRARNKVAPTEPTPAPEPVPEIVAVEYVVPKRPESFNVVLSPISCLLSSTGALSSHQSSVANTVSAGPSAAHNFAKPSPEDIVLEARTAPERNETKKKPAAAQPNKTPLVKQTKEKDALLAQFSSLALKNHVSFVVIGHIDHGKSTLMGRLLLDSGELDSRQNKKNERESAKIGKSSFALAWAMDATKEERERGVTVDVGEASFETENTHFTVVDAPGHRDYVPNMIAGVSQADLAVLVVDAGTNAFEAGFSLDGQTKEHAVLARSLGIDTMIVAVNKLETRQWSEDRFGQIREQLTEFLTKSVGFSKLVFVPTSGLTGENVVKSTGQATWYKGPTLVGALEAVELPKAAKDKTLPFRFLVSNVFQESHQPHTSLSGRVLCGAIEKGDPLVNAWNETTGTLKGVSGSVMGNDIDAAVAGDIVELKTDLDKELCRAGDVICCPESLLSPHSKIVAKILLFELQKPLLLGSRFALYMGRINEAARLVKIVETLEKNGKTIKKNPKFLKKGQAARVVLELERPTVLAPFEEVRDLGRFVLRSEGATIGGGVVEGFEN